MAVTNHSFVHTDYVRRQHHVALNFQASNTTCYATCKRSYGTRSPLTKLRKKELRHLKIKSTQQALALYSIQTFHTLQTQQTKTNEIKWYPPNRKIFVSLIPTVKFKFLRSLEKSIRTNTSSQKCNYIVQNRSNATERPVCHKLMTYWLKLNAHTAERKKKKKTFEKLHQKKKN